MNETPVQIGFEGGTLVVRGGEPALLSQLPGCRPDPRLPEQNVYRAEAKHYRLLIETLRQRKLPYEDTARAYQPTAWQLQLEQEPYPVQLEALAAWWAQRAQGVVVLPTGTGKTFLAVLAIQKAGRPTLVITPTIDLLNQWYAQLELAFGGPIGLLGGGYHDFQPLTVTTYDSAHLYVERWGHKFGLLVFDECHHLPGPSYMLAAVGSLAPFRLGLTATPERADGQERLLPELIGPIVFRRDIDELTENYLAKYDVRRLYVALTADEQAAYQEAREIYRGFVESRGIAMSSPTGWQRFIQESARSPEGRAAFRAYREQKKISQAAPGKMHLLDRLLSQHHADRVLIFTADNATAYHIARHFLVPIITHQTKTKERQQILQRFHSGEYNVIATSQVLNEGVDVPAANVGIILSGTGSVREHVQRLGRLLRKQGDKQALLYEVVTRDTAEEFVSDRRRQHRAYQ